MIFYVGDTHGSVKHLQEVERKAVEAGAEIIIQVGDFGIYFAEVCQIAEWFKTRDGGLPWITCGGNHDNWPLWRGCPEVEAFGGTLIELAPDCYFAERGTPLTLLGEKHLFFGGAESIDKVYRTPGIDWWEEETPTTGEVNNFFDMMESYKPDVVVTHDAPLRITIKKYNRWQNQTPRSLEQVIKHCDHTPARWYFGHHHIMDEWDVEGTKYYCCGLHGEYYASDGHVYKNKINTSYITEEAPNGP